MNERRAIAFLAHAIVTGKGNLSADEQDTLKQLAGRYPVSGTRVQRRADTDIPADSGFPGGATIPEFVGVINSVDTDTDMVTVALDTPIEVPGPVAGIVGSTSEITVPTAWVEPETPAA